MFIVTKIEYLKEHRDISNVFIDSFRGEFHSIKTRIGVYDYDVFDDCVQMFDFNLHVFDTDDKSIEVWDLESFYNLVQKDSRYHLGIVGQFIGLDVASYYIGVYSLSDSDLYGLLKAKMLGCNINFNDLTIMQTGTNIQSLINNNGVLKIPNSIRQVKLNGIYNLKSLILPDSIFKVSIESTPSLRKVYARNLNVLGFHGAELKGVITIYCSEDSCIDLIRPASFKHGIKLITPNFITRYNAKTKEITKEVNKKVV